MDYCKKRTEFIFWFTSCIYNDHCLPGFYRTFYLAAWKDYFSDERSQFTIVFRSCLMGIVLIYSCIDDEIDRWRTQQWNPWINTDQTGFRFTDYFWKVPCSPFACYYFIGADITLLYYGSFHWSYRSRGNYYGLYRIDPHERCLYQHRHFCKQYYK